MSNHPHLLPDGPILVSSHPHEINAVVETLEAEFPEAPRDRIRAAIIRALGETHETEVSEITARTRVLLGA